MKWDGRKRERECEMRCKNIVEEYENRSRHKNFLEKAKKEMNKQLHEPTFKVCFLKHCECMKKQYR